MNFNFKKFMILIGESSENIASDLLVKLEQWEFYWEANQNMISSKFEVVDLLTHFLEMKIWSTNGIMKRIVERMWWEIY
jgi:hypothetical protein